MNKILLKNNELFLVDIDNSISVKKIQTAFSNIENITIIISKDTTLEITHQNEKETKNEIFIKVMPNVNFKLVEIKDQNNHKAQYHFDIEEESVVHIYKLYNVDKNKEVIYLNLNGNKAKCYYYFKTITTNEEKYNIIVNHNASNTESFINNAGVNIEDGRLYFDISSFVPHGMKNCYADQTARIINLTNNKCIINPNLYIEDSDVVANHAAAIGRFSDDEIFYLMSRGIKRKDAINLLIKGFLLENLELDQNHISWLTNNIEKMVMKNV
jgi:Fe-S cluster assembly scaffold protein SufB